MRVTPHSALAISICALALLSQIPSVHPYGGVFENNGDNIITTYAQKYVMEHLEELGLSNIRWSNKNKKTLSLARVTWDKQVAFMKCAIVSVSNPIKNPEINMFEVNTREANAFSALKEAKDKLIAKKLADVYATGQRNVIDPLHRFSFDEDNGNKYFCHLYSYIDGVLLEDYFKKHTISEAFNTAAIILPEVIKGKHYCCL
ncbi:hypothetical protein BDF22DRAFT_242403 [Syncephalis plumigaleata]|nr:hypothetical protein BDF22DRAFT_242403 [Syncephalis plumigaleata]